MLRILRGRRMDETGFLEIIREADDAARIRRLLAGATDGKVPLVLTVSALAEAKQALPEGAGASAILEHVARAQDSAPHVYLEASAPRILEGVRNDLASGTSHSNSVLGVVFVNVLRIVSHVACLRGGSARVAPSAPPSTCAPCTSSATWSRRRWARC